MQVTGKGNDTIVPAEFGEFTIAGKGYKRIALESLNDEEANNGTVESLVLRGASIEMAHFNLKERRNAASVHLSYPIDAKTDIEAFYCEVTAIEDPTATFYMACGWHRGYFGMQVNSPKERRIIFSVLG